MTAVEVASPLEAAFEVLKPGLNAPTNSERIVAAKCIGLMVGYHERWKETTYQIQYVERVLTSELLNPDTGRTSRTFTVAGKVDVGATDSMGRFFIVDHKSTSEDITDPNGSYWRQLVVESQASHYMLFEQANGQQVDYAIWDVMRKPGISPKQITKKERESITFSRSYCGYELTADDVEEFQASERETPLMYAARLATDCTTDRPQWYFQRRTVARMESEINEYAKELWMHSQDMILARRLARNPRNSGACMLYGRPCKFLGICSNHDSPNSDNWAHRTWTHPELPVLGTDGRDVLTNSRVRTFQTCRRKHELQYGVGLEKIDDAEAESLYFGSLWHEAQEAYFLTLKSIQEKN